MAMKQLAKTLQPLPLYFILGLTVCLFFVELVIAHITHSLTLLLDAYHALCNILVLVGTIISTKYGSGRTDKVTTATKSSQEELKSLSAPPNKPEMCSATKPGPESSLINTFGWARVDVLVLLIGCVSHVCLCFSVVLEALQTLIHISHHDEMHGPVYVLVLGIVSFVLNLLAYVLIGGYTSHHGSFLNSSDEAVVASVNNKTVTQTLIELNANERRRQGLWGLCRDCVGSLVVIVCAVVVDSTESQVAKFVDPMFSIFSTILLLILSYPFVKESACILMQTIPDHIDLNSLRSQLVTEFPDVVNVHELHVWKLTRGKTICTAHIIFLNPMEYSKRTDDISRFFLGQGITHVTVQPEFFKDINNVELLEPNLDCLMECREDLCMERQCCGSRSPSLRSVQVDSHSQEDLCMERRSCGSRSPSLQSVQVSSHSNSHKHKGCHKSRTAECSKPCSNSPTQSEAVATSCISQVSDVNKDIPSDVSQSSSVDLVSKSEEESKAQEVSSEEDAVKSKLPE